MDANLNSQKFSNFSARTPRIAILGAGGMGRVAWQELSSITPDTARYQDRFFVACDSAASQQDLLVLLRATGTETRRKPYPSSHSAVLSWSSCLLILDNLETLWDRRGVGMHWKNSVPAYGCGSLALVGITMRGAERPDKVRWTRPFLLPLKPLDQDAARQTFLDIADSVHKPEEVDKVLSLTDNMPLAINLLAHLVDSEGCSNVLSRWEVEKTSLISEGYDRRSNLELSILCLCRVLDSDHCLIRRISLASCLYFRRPFGGGAPAKQTSN
ncbi:hypothetical protein B0H13DRAFT_1717833 [Mycena leptocephala]|nr:hypothetical protein B0H13DRAFT_1717833 [Mycena leptocephala]